MKQHEIEHLDPESDHVREVYARFGLAVYHAQCFEHGLANLNLVAHLVRAKGVVPTQALWETLVDEVLDTSFSKTMGNLIKELRKVITLDDRTIELIIKAKENRDELCHKFFRENAEDFMTTAGRDRMLQRIERLDQEIREADAVVELIQGATGKHINMTPEKTAEFYKKYEAEIIARG